MTDRGFNPERGKDAVEAEWNTDFLHELLEAIPSPIFCKDAQGRYIGGNTAWASKILGLSLDQVVGRTVHELPNQIPQDLASEYHEADQELMREGRNQSYEAEVLCSDGIRREFQFHKAVIRGQDGTATGIVGVMTDVSERNRTQRLLARQTEQYDEILSDVSVGIYVTDLDGQVIQANEGFRKILGYDGLEPLQKVHASTLYADPSHREELLETLMAVGSVNRTVTLLQKSGEPFEAQIFARLRGSKISGFISKIDRSEDVLLIVTCAWCERMRGGGGVTGTWRTPVEFFMKNKALIKNPEVDFAFTHGVCQDCVESLSE